MKNWYNEIKGTRVYGWIGRKNLSIIYSCKNENFRNLIDPFQEQTDERVKHKGESRFIKLSILESAGAH